MIFVSPTGLSGVSTTAIAVWLMCWVGLEVAWKRRDVHGCLVIVGLCSVATSFILIFLHLPISYLLLPCRKRHAVESLNLDIHELHPP